MCLLRCIALADLMKIRDEAVIELTWLVQHPDLQRVLEATQDQGPDQDSSTAAALCCLSDELVSTS